MLGFAHKGFAGMIRFEEVGVGLVTCCMNCLVLNLCVYADCSGNHEGCRGNLCDPSADMTSA